MVVNHIVQVASMLSLPDLEAETKAAINQFIRDSLGKPAALQGSNPLTPRAQAEEILGADLVGEWIGKEAVITNV